MRLPAVAGWFYPGNAAVLAESVDDMLARAPAPGDATPVRMLLAPHAGYAYSGAVAARGFNRIRSAGAEPARVFIVGPSHVEAFDFTSVFDGNAYRTPLGDVPVDTGATSALAGADPSIRAARHGHEPPPGERGEHGIEVELPFLQRVLPGARIVPIVMGSQSWEACDALGRAIARIADWRHDLVIASSDLSHFYPYPHARRLDAVFCETLCTLDAALLYRRVSRRECEACGAGPVIAGLIATGALDARHGEVLACINSGDVTGEHASVVGYAAAVITGDPA